MQPFVILHGLEHGLVSEAQLAKRSLRDADLTEGLTIPPGHFLKGEDRFRVQGAFSRRCSPQFCPRHHLTRAVPNGYERSSNMTA